MAIGAQRGLADFDAAYHRDLRCHLHRRQDAALAGFRALTQFDLEHAHLFVSSDGAQALLAEMPLCITHAIFGGTDLKHDVGATFKVIGR